MPSLQVAFECTSPVLSYDSDWSFGTSRGDGLADRYTDASFILTQKAGAQMTFSFVGSSVSVVGAKRGNHGRFQGQIDSDTATRLVGDGSATPEEFNSTLYTWSGSNGRHLLTFQNVDDQFLDVDYMAITMNIGRSDEALITDTYQETSSAFTFTPAASWSRPTFPGSYSGGSGLVTADMNAVAQFKFTGDGVALYGPVGDGHRVTYSVQVDNGSPAVFRPPPALPQVTTSRELLFITSGLGSGTHTLSIRLSERTASGQTLAIDYADVFTTSSIGSSLVSSINAGPSNSQTTPGTSPPGPDPSGRDALALGTSSDVSKFKAALAVTSTLAGLALAALVISILLFRQRLRKAQEKRLNFDTPSVMSPPLPMQNHPVSMAYAANTAVSPVGGFSYMSHDVGSPQRGPSSHAPTESITGNSSAYGGMASSPSEGIPQTGYPTEGKRQLVLHNDEERRDPGLPAYSYSQR